MLETILSLAGSAAGGGILGVAGNWLKSRGERKLIKMQNEHAVSMRKLDQGEMRLEAELALQQIEATNKGKLALANVEAQRAFDVAATELQKQSYNADKATYGGGWVDKIRGLMRPTITVFLLIVTTYIAVTLTGILGGLDSLPSDELFNLYITIINAIVFLTTTAVTWWFGTRPTNKRYTKNAE